MKGEQVQQEHVMALIEAGSEHDPKRPKFRKLEEKLLKIVKQVEDDIVDGNFLPYLKRIAHNLAF